MKVKKLVVGVLQENCYLVWDEPSLEAVCIDPGDAGDYISAEIMREKLDLKAILLTHAHFDHVLGTLEVKLNFSSFAEATKDRQVPVYLNRADEFLYKTASKSSEHWVGIKGGPVPEIDEYLKEGAEVRFGSEALKVLTTPGHTPGSVCFYSEKEGVLFSGDTLFRQGIGRTDFSYSDAALMQKSLKRLSELPGETVVYSGHGEETLIKQEL